MHMKAPSRVNPMPAAVMCTLAPLLVEDEPAVEEVERTRDPETPVAVGPGIIEGVVYAKVVPFWSRACGEYMTDELDNVAVEVLLSVEVASTDVLFSEALAEMLARILVAGAEDGVVLGALLDNEVVAAAADEEAAAEELGAADGVGVGVGLGVEDTAALVGAATTCCWICTELTTGAEEEAGADGGADAEAEDPPPPPLPAPESGPWKTTKLALTPCGTVTTQKAAPPAPSVFAPTISFTPLVPGSIAQGRPLQPSPSHTISTPQDGMVLRKGVAGSR